MPRRRRHQELKRKIDREVRRVEQEDERRAHEMAYLWANPLSDLFWADREFLGPCDPDDDCYFYCPHENNLTNVQSEIDQFRSDERALRTRDAHRVTRHRVA